MNQHVNLYKRLRPCPKKGSGRPAGTQKICHILKRFAMKAVVCTFICHTSTTANFSAKKFRIAVIYLAYICIDVFDVKFLTYFQTLAFL